MTYKDQLTPPTRRPQIERFWIVSSLWKRVAKKERERESQLWFIEQEPANRASSLTRHNGIEGRLISSVSWDWKSPKKGTCCALIRQYICRLAYYSPRQRIARTMPSTSNIYWSPFLVPRPSCSRLSLPVSALNFLAVYLFSLTCCLVIPQSTPTMSVKIYNSLVPNVALTPIQ